MNIFELHNSIIQDYKSYLNSFMNIRDERVRTFVDQQIKEGRFIKEPIIRFKPSYKLGESFNDLTAQGLVLSDLPTSVATHALAAESAAPFQPPKIQSLLVVTSPLFGSSARPSVIDERSRATLTASAYSKASTKVASPAATRASASKAPSPGSAEA